MEVKPGYKQTEVGVIPEEWEAGGLGRFWSVTDCKHVTAKFVPLGFPLASIKEVQSRFVDLTNAKQTTSHFYNLLIEGGRKPYPGDLILSRNATVGEVAQVAEWHPPFAMGQDVCLLRKKSPDHSTEFLHAVFQSPVIANQLSNLMVGSTFKRANVEQIRNFSVPMPTAPEQRAIAGALSDVDALLGALDRLIAKKRDLKQAAMQQLLTGQTRLPGFHGEWEVKRLGDVGACLRGVSYQGDGDLSSHDTTNTKRLLRSNNVQNATVVTTDIQFVNALRVSVNQLLRENDILICMANGSKALVGKAGLFRVNDSYEYTFGAFMGCFRTNSVEANPSFVFYLFQTGRYRDCISNLLAGSSINNLRPSSVESLEFSTPPLPEQTAIAEVLTVMDAELAALEQRRDKTRALKQGMMQELLTGSTRLI